MARSRKRGRTGQHKTAPWVPVVQGTINPALTAVRIANGVAPPDSVWFNDIYQVVVTEFDSGVTHLSIKRNDRHTIKDWRHLQAMKNEICGSERIGCELYPPESLLVDSANEYHIWVLPEGHDMPFGFMEKLVSSDWQVEDFNAGRERGDHKGRQRPFQPNLPVGVDRNELPDADVSMSQTAKLSQAIKA